MNKKKICAILLSTSVIIGTLSGLGVSNNPVYAADLSSESVLKKMHEASNDTHDIKDYSIKINKTVEKQGVKFTIKDVAASKNKMRINAEIESSTPFEEKSLNNQIIQMTVKNCDYERQRKYSQVMSNNTMMYKFDFYSNKGFDKNIDLRFDSALPAMNINTWVNASVDISDSFDKVLEKDVEFTFADNEFFKFESDTIETSLYYNGNKTDYIEDEYDNSYDMLLLKCNDKIYGLMEGYPHMDDKDELIGQYSTSCLKYGDISSDSKLSLIPISCKIKRDEMENIFKEYDYYKNHTIEEDKSNKISYSKNFIFSDNTSGMISKVEREGNKIRAYCSVDSEKKIMLMTVGLMGYYNYGIEDYNNRILSDYDSYKVTYKNPENENEYIVEFSNVVDNVPFIIDGNDAVFGLSDKVEIGKEIEIK